MAFHAPTKGRVRRGPLASTEADGNNGFFFLQLTKGGRSIAVQCSDGGGWEHVSVSFPDRCPTWKEMCQVKAIFWDEEDVVIQFHPAKSEYVTMHPFCLHLWRPAHAEIPTPPSIFVGLK